MLTVELSPVNIGGGVIIRLNDAQGPITLSRTDPSQNPPQTYSLLSAVPDIQLYIDMGDKAPEVLQPNVSYGYTITDGVSNYTFTLSLPSPSPVKATYDNMIYLLQRLAMATIANIAFPRSPSGADDPIKKADVYISAPMTENIQFPAVFINQELLRQEEIPVGAASPSQQYYFSGTTGLYKRVFSFTVIDPSATTCNFYHDVLFSMALSLMSDVFGNTALQQSLHFEVQSTGGPKYGQAFAPMFYVSQILLTVKGPLNMILNPVQLGTIKAINVSLNGGTVYPVTQNLVSNLAFSSL